MKTHLLVSVSAIALLALAGCEVERESPPDDAETVFDDQIRALDKAKAVEELNDERLKKLREAEDGKVEDDGAGR